MSDYRVAHVACTAVASRRTYERCWNSEQGLSVAKRIELEGVIQRDAESDVKQMRSRCRVRGKQKRYDAERRVNGGVSFRKGFWFGGGIKSSRGVEVGPRPDPLAYPGKVPM